MNIIDLLQEHNIPYRTEGHHHTRAGWVQVDCPFCAEHGKWHMGYNLTYGYCNCWQCGPHSVPETIAHLLNKDYREIQPLLRGLKTQRFVKPRLKGRLALPQGVSKLLGPHKRYLRSRDFDPAQLLRLWGIQGIGPVSPQGLAWRLFIPIVFRGDVVSWTTRSISEAAHGKYKMAPPQNEAISHHDLLYGWDYVRHSVLVFEGPPDVWQIGPGSVSTFGTQWSDEQLLKLSSIPRVTVCFDNEGIAQRRARKLVSRLTLLGCETQNIMVRRLGPDIPKSEVKKLRRYL